jgi:hypothetical protein
MMTMHTHAQWLLEGKPPGLVWGFKGAQEHDPCKGIDDAILSYYCGCSGMGQQNLGYLLI